MTVGWHESKWCVRVETANAALVASDVIARSHQCGHAPADVLTAYAARPCGSIWPTLASRVRGYWWALSLLRKAGAT